MTSRKAAFRALGFAALALAGPVRAEEPSGCAAFKWDIAQDQAALAAPGGAAVEDGGVLRAGSAVTIHLAPTDKIHFPLPPERAPRPETHGAVVELAAPAPGAYRISLSEGAWIDVIEDGALLKPLAFSGAKDCPHVRKILKYQLAGKKTVLQVSNAAAADISLVVLPE
jgi:hypothetical protein